MTLTTDEARRYAKEVADEDTSDWSDKDWETYWMLQREATDVENDNGNHQRSKTHERQTDH